ncbi:MAG: thioredoxin [Kiritimatiellaceae bacterium]|nr:thioredoxin [Kiritimatiellaceae bacterium]
MNKLALVMAVVVLGITTVQAEEKAKEATEKKAEATVLKLNKANFDKTIKAEGVVIVDFWASWCGPCRVQGPILEELAKEVGTKAVIAKVNVDENSELATKYKIQSIPTLIVFKDGKVKKQLVGVHQKDQLIKIIENSKK